jgi:hypothetical protein
MSYPLAGDLSVVGQIFLRFAIALSSHMRYDQHAYQGTLALSTFRRYS